jgi:hypothetical protein
MHPSGRCYNHKKCAVIKQCLAPGCEKYTGSKSGYCHCTAKNVSTLSKMKLEAERSELIMGYWITNKLEKN